MLAETRWVIINLCSYIYKSYSRCMQISLLYSWSFVFYKNYGEIHFLCSSCSSIYHFSYISFARMFFMTFILKTSPVDKTDWSLTFLFLLGNSHTFLFSLQSPKNLRPLKFFLSFSIGFNWQGVNNQISSWHEIWRPRMGLIVGYPPSGQSLSSFSVVSMHKWEWVSFVNEVY